MLMRCIIEFSKTKPDGHRELIDVVHLHVATPSDARTLALAMMKHTIIRGRVADVAVIKSTPGRIIDVVDGDRAPCRRKPDCEPDKSAGLVG
jgi:hypothetical protein